MKSATVAVVECVGYEESRVEAAVRCGIDLLGGIEKFCRVGESIVLKPNLLAGDSPAKALTTHPAVFRALGVIFKEAGANVSFGDSPALAKPERAAKTAGILDVAAELNIPLADFVTGVTVSFPQALLAKQLTLAAGVVHADGIVGIPKMKTHGFTRITGAVKNQFGCLPGLQKAEFHVKMPDIFDFSKVLTDINSYLNMRLFVMDGIIAMEGNGPRSGEPIAMNALLFSSDPVALDAVCCRLIDMDPRCVPTSEIGEAAGLGTWREEQIQLVGTSLARLQNKSFKAVRKPPERYVSAKSFPTFLKRWISPRPVIIPSNCVKCGQCVQMCPVNPKALRFPDGETESTNQDVQDVQIDRDNKNNIQIPKYDYNKCIRCYCCQEICPKKAITIYTPFLGRFIH